MSGPSAVRTISRIAFFLSLQGAGQLALCLMELLSTPVMFFYAARGRRPLPSNGEATLLFGWLLVVGVAGVLSLRAGRFNREYRGRRLAFVAFALGPASCVLGIPLMIYGVWCYRRPDVRALFDRGESGVGAWEIEHSS